MNKKSVNNRCLYYPAAVYVGTLLLVWLLSWLLVVARLAMGNSATMHSLVSAEGLRWAVRTALHTIDAAPWGVILLFIFSLGLLNGSGMVKSVGKLLKGTKPAYNERKAWLFALAAVVICSLLLIASTLSPWNLLLGVTGDFYASPLVQGRIIISFIAVSVVASAFGFIYGNYRSFIDIARSVGEGMMVFAPALLAVVPATGILPCLEYAGLLPLLHIDQADTAVVSDILYLLPFIYIMIVLRGQR